ncbi:MAG: phosphoenolpyruvate synthase, partial [Muribaculaceae bacterium]|nr:phosphoenolpyruvate synthase [Muribaculaceae bacterium]
LRRQRQRCIRDRVPVQQYADTGVLRYMVSTYDANDQMIHDYEYGRGRRIVTFANILRDRVVPLAPAIDFMLKQGQSAMQRPVEIEFACNITRNAADPKESKGHIYWLQIRPIIDRKELVDDAALDVEESRLLLRSNTALGNGRIDNLRTVVYVRTQDFDSVNNRAIVGELNALNRRFIENDENYILIGPGRWGSSDEALGIPVQWPDISAARLIVEASLPDYRIEPSQGTHFFHNLTSFGVGYFTVDPASDSGMYDSRWLDSLPAEYESRFLRVVRFAAPLEVAINGRRGVGIVVKPDENEQSESGYNE